MQTNSNISGTTAASVGSKVDAAMSDASSEFHNFLSDIEDLVKETTTLTGEDLSRAKAKLSERLAEARESVGEMGNAIAQKARNTATVTNDYVHEQPWKAIGAGAAIGLLVGFALARR